MKKYKYEVIANNLNSSSEITKGKTIYYRCQDCGDIIPSLPKDNTNCSCGNIVIDKDYWRLHIRNYSSFEVIEKKLQI